jgi:hypothetical protein
VECADIFTGDAEESPEGCSMDAERTARATRPIAYLNGF